jgi:hypothetical protein
MKTTWVLVVLMFAVLAMCFFLTRRQTTTVSHHPSREQVEQVEQEGNHNTFSLALENPFKGNFGIGTVPRVAREDRTEDKLQQISLTGEPGLPTIYIGDHFSPYWCAFLVQANIGLVINAAHELEDIWDHNFARTGTHRHTNTCDPNVTTPIRYMRLDLEDSHTQSLLTVLPETSRAIADTLRSGKSVLVHCAAGVSRSVAMAMGFLIQNNQMTAEQALTLIRSVRTQAHPNANFIRQLEELQS